MLNIKVCFCLHLKIKKQSKLVTNYKNFNELFKNQNFKTHHEQNKILKLQTKSSKPKTFFYFTAKTPRRQRLKSTRLTKRRSTPKSFLGSPARTLIKTQTRPTTPTSSRTGPSSTPGNSRTIGLQIHPIMAPG